MAGLITLAALLTAAAGLLCHEAAGLLFQGVPWAAEVCNRAGPFCKHPEYLGYAAAALLLMALITKLGGALQG